MNKPKILLFDIETAPNLAYVWGKWEQNVIEFERNWYMMTFAAKWLGSKQIIGHTLADFSSYKKDREDDGELVKKLWELMNEADIIIAHNGDEFDIKKTNVRFIEHGLTPPAPYKTIDTKKVAKKYFKWDSNKLDDLGEYLKVGRKLDTGGFELWKGCMEGDQDSWSKMLKYNKQDVVLLEKVYLRLRPWMTNYPIYTALKDKPDECPACHGKRIQSRGTEARLGGKTVNRFQCQECGKWLYGKINKPTCLKQTKQS